MTSTSNTESIRIRRPASLAAEGYFICSLLSCLMGSGNLLGAGSRFGAGVYKQAEDQVEKQKFKKNKEVEAEMISDVKIETALKIKKLLLLGTF